jgi:hypothetical protein
MRTIFTTLFFLSLFTIAEAQSAESIINDCKAARTEEYKKWNAKANGKLTAEYKKSTTKETVVIDFYSCCI